MDSYLEFLFKLKLNMVILENLMKSPADLTKEKEYFKVNKDLISRHINSVIYQKIEKHQWNFAYDSNEQIQNLNTLINELKSKEELKNEDIIKDEGIYSLFIHPQILKMNTIEYPTNFFILDANIFNSYNFYNKANKSPVSIGTEGIFIKSSLRDDDDNIKFSVYFIKSKNKIKLEEFHIDKIYIYDTIEQFEKEFNNNMKGKKPESYFARKNFSNDRGIFNVIDDGKKIGLYVNINRVENYFANEHSNENKPNREYLEKFLE